MGATVTTCAGTRVSPPRRAQMQPLDRTNLKDAKETKDNQVLPPARTPVPKLFISRCYCTNLSRGRVAVDQPVAAGELAAGEPFRTRSRPLSPGFGHASVPEAAEVVDPVRAPVEKHRLVAAVQLTALYVAGE